MTQQNNILEELNSISATVAGIGQQMPQQVPQGYFEGFAAQVLLRLKTEQAIHANEETAILSPLLSAIVAKNPYRIPSGYFEELPENATAGAKAIDFVNEALENLSPMMQELKAKQAFTVPDGYFQQFPQQMLEKVPSVSGATVVSMRKKSSWIQYAVAACFLGVLAIAGWFYTHQTTVNSLTEVAKVEKEMKALKDDEIEQYINAAQSNYEPATAMVAAAELKQDDIKDMISDISDEELEQYLEKHTQIKESLN